MRFIIAVLLGIALSLHAADGIVSANAEVEPKADAVLKKMSEFYKSQKAGSGEVAFDMKIDAPSTKREAHALYTVVFQRPNQFSIVLKDGAMGATMASDGKALTTHMPASGKYTQKPAPASFDELFSTEDMMIINQSIANMLLVDRLLGETPDEALLEGVKTVKYCGLEDFEKTKAHHLALAQEEFDWDLWIQDGKEPFLLKVQPDLTRALKAELGAEAIKNMTVSLTVKFNNWKSEDKIAEERFKFKPPADAQKVATLFTMVVEEAAELLGKEAPPLNVQTLDGKKVDLRAHKGKDIVVIDFWATWCGPCVKALPTINEIAEKYRDKGVVFYAVNEREDAKKLKEFQEKHKLTMPIALDEDGSAGEVYGVTGIPYTVLIGRDGTVQSVHVGLPPNLKDLLPKELETLIAGKSLLEQEALPTKAEIKKN